MMALPRFTAASAVPLLDAVRSSCSWRSSNPKICNPDELRRCFDEEQRNYNNCITSCSPWCSSEEIVSQTCKSLSCCICFARRNCAQRRIRGLVQCRRHFGCPPGRVCTEDIAQADRFYCCPPEITACSGQCVTCVNGVVDPITCQCECPPNRVLCGSRCCDEGEVCCDGTCTKLCTDENCTKCGDKVPAGSKCCPDPQSPMGCKPTKLCTDIDCTKCGEKMPHDLKCCPKP